MPRYYGDLTTLQDVQNQLEKASASSTLTADFNSYMADAIPGISRFIASECERDFVPYIDTLTLTGTDDYTYRAWGYRRGHFRLYLDELPNGDILEIDSLTIEGTAVSSSAYRLEPNNRWPPQYVVFNDSVAGIPTSGLYDFDHETVIVGTFGYHNDPNQLYTEIETGASLGTTTGTSLSVTDADDYRVYEYIRMESEFLQVVARDTEADTLTVRRGVQGSTAATHSSVAIERVNVISDIQLAATRLVSWAYNNRNDLGTQLQLPDGSVIRNQMPAFVKSIINRHRRLRVRSI